MRIALPCSLFLVSVLGCGRAELLEPPTVEQPAVVDQPTANDSRLRLRSSFDGSDGFRFSDGAVLTRRTFLSGGDVVTETRTSAGVVVEGDAARTELQSDSGRFFTLAAPAGALCVIRRPVASLTEITASDCTEWKTMELFQVTSTPPSSMGATALVVTTGWDTAYRVRILESGWVEATDTDDMVFEFDRYPAPAACVVQAGCVVSRDCCNRRHTCFSGVCDY